MADMRHTLTALLCSASCLGAPGVAAASTGGFDARTPSRPVASRFELSPRSITAGAAPDLVVRIDRSATATVRARLVLEPLAGGRRLEASLGRLAAGRVVHVRWPDASPRPTAGRYSARLSLVGIGLDRSVAPGRSPLDVVAPPAASTGVAFPVAGPHQFGEGFGVDRGDHRHEGVDILAARGTPVVSPTAGIVVSVGWQPTGAGRYVVVDAGAGRAFFFAHCIKSSVPVVPGSRIQPGSRLCSVGSTGRSSANHLHFEVWENGWRVDASSQPVDPMPFLRSPG